jgi:hypothetical protein
MKRMPRIAWLVCVAGSTAPAIAQDELVTYSWSFLEVVAGSVGQSTPVTSPNGLVEPGEAVRFQLTITISPGIGATITYPPPPPPGTGTVGALAWIAFDMLGAGGDPAGTFNTPGRGLGWGLGFPGTPLANGWETCNAGQIPGTSFPLSTANPIPAIWRAVWTPASYAPRAQLFQSRAAAALPSGQHSAIYVQYALDPEANPLYVWRNMPGSFGEITIPIVPGPTAGTVMVVACAAAIRRRRREDSS